MEKSSEDGEWIYVHHPVLFGRWKIRFVRSGRKTDPGRTYKFYKDPGSMAFSRTGSHKLVRVVAPLEDVFLVANKLHNELIDTFDKQKRTSDLAMYTAHGISLDDIIVYATYRKMTDTITANPYNLGYAFPGI